MRRAGTWCSAICFGLIFCVLGPGPFAEAQSTWPVEVVPVSGHPREISNLALSPDGRVAASAGSEGRIKVWDIASERLLRTLAGHEAVKLYGSTHRGVNSIDFSPDGGRIASGGGDRSIRLFEVESGRQLWSQIANSIGISIVAFHPDGGLVATGGEHDFSWDSEYSHDKTPPRTLRIFRAATGEFVHAFGDYTWSVNQLGFSSDGRTMFTIGAERVLNGDTADDFTVIILWDVESGRRLWRVEVPGAFPRDMRAAFSDGDRLAVMTAKGSEFQLTHLSAQTGAAERSALVQAREWTLLAARPGGHFLVASPSDAGNPDAPSDDRKVESWHLGAQAIARTPITHGAVEHFEVSRWAVWSADGKQFGGPTGRDGFAFWSAKSGAHYFGASIGLKQVRFAQGDAALLLTASGDGNASLWDLNTLTRKVMPLGALEPTDWHATRSRALGAIPYFDRSMLVLLGDREPSDDQSCRTCASRVIDPSTGEPLLPLTDDEMIIEIDAAAPPTRMATYQFKTRAVRLWDLRQRKLTQTIDLSREGTIENPSVSVRHQWLVWRTKGTVHVLDIATGRKRRINVAAEDIDLSTDGKLLATIDDTGRIQVRSLMDLTVVTSVSKARWFGVKFAADNQHLMVRGRRAIQIHSLATGKFEEIGRSGAGGLAARYLNPRLLVLGSRYGAGGSFQLFDTSKGQLRPLFKLPTHEFDSISVTSDGTMVAAAVGRVLHLLNVASGKTIRQLEGHLADITYSGFSSDGRRIVTASDDGSTRIWDTATGDPIATLIARDDGRWVAVSPEGFFAASSNDAFTILSIVRGTAGWELAQVWHSLFNPDLVREKLAGDKDGEVANAAKETNLAKIIESGPEPAVTITAPVTDHVSRSELIDVRAQIEDRGRGIGRIEWRVNGATVRVSRAPIGHDTVFATSEALPLDVGDNTIEVVAYTARDTLASLPKPVKVRFEAPAESIKPKLHVLAIGINAYVDRGEAANNGEPPSRFEPLTLAVKDAVALAAGLERSGQGLYSEVKVRLLLDKEATRPGIARAFEELGAQVQPRDTFILFAAAHGSSVDGRFYLIPQDYQGGTDPGALMTGAIGQDQLQDWLVNRIRARRAVLLLDTCESGALISGYRRSRLAAPSTETAVGRLHEATGRPVLTAAAEGQFAHEGLVDGSGQQHGVFTFALLDALRNGDGNRNGTIELTELVAHVQNVVPRIAAKLGGTGRAAAAVVQPEWGKQSARFGSRGENFVIVPRLSER